MLLLSCGMTLGLKGKGGGYARHREVPSFGRKEGALASLVDQSAIHIGFLAINNPSKYLDIARMMMRNIENTTSRPVHYHVITDVSHEKVQKIMGENGYTTYNLKDISPKLFAVYKKLAATVGGWDAETARLYMYKPLLHRILPESLSRLIVVDLDIWITRDIAGLWQQFDEFRDTHIMGAALEQQPSYFPCWNTPTFVQQFGAVGFAG